MSAFWYFKKHSKHDLHPDSWKTQDVKLPKQRLQILNGQIFFFSWSLRFFIFTHGHFRLNFPDQFLEMIWSFYLIDFFQIIILSMFLLTSIQRLFKIPVISTNYKSPWINQYWIILLFKFINYEIPN